MFSLKTIIALALAGTCLAYIVAKRLQGSATPPTIDTISETLLTEGPEVALDLASDFTTFFANDKSSSAIGRADTIRVMAMALATNDSLPEAHLVELIPFMNTAVDLVTHSSERDPLALEVFKHAGQLFHFVAQYEEAALTEEAGLRYRHDLPEADPIALALEEISLAETLAELNRTDQALQLCRQALPTLEKNRDLYLTELITLHNIMGAVHLGNGDFEEALPHFEQALTDHLELVDRPEISDDIAPDKLRDEYHGIQINLATTWDGLGQRGKAREIYEELEQRFDLMGGQTLHRVQAAISFSFIEQRESLYDRAYSRLQAAASALEDEPETNAPMRGRVLVASATFCLETGRFEEGLSQAMEAVDLLESQGERSRTMVPQALLRQAQLSAEFDNRDVTQALFERALSQQTDVTGPESAEVAQVLVERVAWWRSLDDTPDVGVDDLERAEEILQENSALPRYRIHTGAMLAQSLWNSDRRQEGIDRMVAVARQIEEIRNWSAHSSLGRSGTLSQYLGYTHQLASWRFEQGDHAGAWGVLQRGRARELRERMALGAAEFPRTKQAVADETEVDWIALPDVQNIVIQDKSALLHYAMDSANAHVYVVSEGGLERHSLTLPGNGEPATTESIQELVAGDGESKDLRGILSRRSNPFGLREAQRLLTLRQAVLPETVLEKLIDAESVIVIGADALGVLPFECLVLKPGNDVASTEFWIDRLPRIHYLPAASMLSSSTGGPTLEIANALVVADPDLSKMKQSTHPLAARVRYLEQLPFAMEEVEAVRGAMSGGTVRELTGQDATEQEVVKALRKADLVHFAAHTLVEQRMDHDLAALVLAPSDGAARGADGFLDADEISREEISAALVTLATCNSGYGRVVAGEGVYALGRAFLEAGAGSVVATAWPIRDWASAQLFGSFYAGDDFGRDLSASMWRARRLLRDEAETSHPADWGAYVWLGHP